jgi:hypothetical protein
MIPQGRNPPYLSGGFMTNRFQTKIIDTDAGIKIVIPARFNRYATTSIIPNVLVLVFYFASIMPALLKSGESVALIVLVNAFFLTGLFAFFAYNLFTALWCHYGRETFIIDRTSCSLSKTIFGLGATRRFVLGEAAAIAPVNPETPGKKPRNLLHSIGIGRGRISITHGNKEYYFGAALEQEEAQDLLDKISRYKKI